MAENLIKIQKWLDDMGGIGDLIRFAGYTLWAILIASLFLRICRHFFQKRLKSGNNIQLRFTENIIRVCVVLVAIFWVFNTGDSTSNFGRVLFQGTAIVSAIVGLAAQPVITDLFCGLTLIVSRPFQIGDRIELEDGTAGVVKDINLRHVVINRIDTVEMIIPNSKLNSMTISNMSRNKGRRSVHLRFSVAYGTDVEKAMTVIRNAVISSPYTIAGRTLSYGDDYGPVYFLEYAESSLILATTVYYTPQNPTEEVKSDVNLRVNRALNANGIEIPYNYLNVILPREDQPE